MEYPITKFIMMMIIIGIFIYIVGFGYINLHEDIHKIILIHYKIDSETRINYIWLSGETEADYDEFFEKCNDSCKLAHELNEIIGYNVMPILIAIFITILLWKKK